MALQEEVRTEPCALALRVGKRIREERKRNGLTLAELARACGTSPQTICRMEIAKMTVSLEWIEKIAKAFNIPPDMFFETAAYRDRESMDAVDEAIGMISKLKEQMDVFLREAGQS